MARKQLKGNITRVTTGADEPFGKVNRSINPTKLKDEDFALKENLISKAGNYGSLEKRGAMVLHNANKLTAGKPVVNIFEARLPDKYYLIGKDDGSAGTAVMKYCERPYNTAWTSITSSEYSGFYRFMQFKENIYITNRQNAGAMLTNKVWYGTGTGLVEHGAIPPSQYFPLVADLLTLTTGTIAGAGITTGYYYYIVTFLYDGYQESSAFDSKWVVIGGAHNSIALSKIPVGDSRVKARYIYRSKAQANEYGVGKHFYRVGALLDNTTTEFTDTIADTKLGTAFKSELFFDQKRPPRSKLFAVVQDRLIALNTETDPNTYGAIESAKINLTEILSASKYSGAGGLAVGTYKYRLYKAYANHSGGRLVYLLGKHTEKSISITALGNAVDITIDSTAEIMSDQWASKIVVMRTTAGGDKFFPVSENFLPSGLPIEAGIAHNKMYFVSPMTFRDETPDADHSAVANIFLYDLIYGGETVGNTRVKGALYISEAGKGDLFPAMNVKLVDIRDNVGITGGYVEDGGMVIFSGTGIYRMDTRPLSSDFWTIDKVVENLGALGQDAYVKNSYSGETTGHNGILQLPDGSGYIFLNRASSSVATQPINIYFWSGRGQPEIMSDPIYPYINDSNTFIVTGMCYDFVRDWVWVVAKATDKMILIYDMRNKEWDVFVLDSTLIFSEVICTEDGQILLGATDGQLNTYSPTTYQDELGAVTKTITAKLRTKTFDEHDADLTVRRVSVALDSSTAGATLSQDITTYDQLGAGSASAQTYTKGSGTIHRTKMNTNINCRRFYIEFGNTQNKNIIFNKISIDYKVNFDEDGGQ